MRLWLRYNRSRLKYYWYKLWNIDKDTYYGFEKKLNKLKSQPSQFLVTPKLRREIDKAFDEYVKQYRDKL
jgi:hypothetical protein